MPRYVTHLKTPWEPARAFEYLVDLEHFADWDPGVTRRPGWASRRRASALSTT